MTYTSVRPLVAFKLMMRAAIRSKGTYVYVFRTRKMARYLVWDCIAEWHMPVKVNHSSMTVYLQNGSRVILTGRDNIETIFSLNPVGAIIFESLFSRTVKYLLMPLKINRGWIIFENFHSMKIHNFGRNS